MQISRYVITHRAGRPGRAAAIPDNEDASRCPTARVRIEGMRHLFIIRPAVPLPLPDYLEHHPVEGMLVSPRRIQKRLRSFPLRIVSSSMKLVLYAPRIDPTVRKGRGRFILSLNSELNIDIVHVSICIFAEDNCVSEQDVICVAGTPGLRHTAGSIWGR